MEEKRTHPLSVTSILSWFFLATFLFIVCLPIFVSIYEEKYAYEGWQTVTILNAGTFQVPGDWVFTQQDNVIWLTDKPIDEEGYIIYFLGVIDYSYSPSSSPYTINRTINSVISEISSFPSAGEYVNGGYYGNSLRSWSLSTYVINGEKTSKYSVSLGFDPLIYMISWDNGVDSSTLRLIAESFAYE